MRTSGLINRAISQTNVAAVNPAQTVWRGVVMSQSGGEFQFVDEAGNPLCEDGAPVMGTIAPTGWVLRQDASGEQYPFYPIVELIEVGTFPSSTAQNIGEAVKSMNGHSYGFDIITINGRPLFAPVVNGQLVPLTDEEVAQVAADEEAGTEVDYIVHNGVKYVAQDAVVEDDEADTPITRYVQFHNMQPLLRGLEGGDEICLSYDEAVALVEEGPKVGLKSMSCRVNYGRPRSEDRGVKDMDYIVVVPGQNWPTFKQAKKDASGADYDRDSTLWNAVRPLEATILRLIRHCKALAAQFPDQFGKFPEYCKPVEQGGYIQTAYNAPSREAARAREQRAAMSGIGTNTPAPNLTAGTVGSSIPDTTGAVPDASGDLLAV